jgi:hypothetical protein
VNLSLCQGPEYTRAIPPKKYFYHHQTPLHTVYQSDKMSRNPMDEYMNRMQSMIRQNRGGFPGGRPPAGSGMALAAIAIIGGGALLLQNSLFNVDGGHRAIKYKRLSGVSKEIYTEGPLSRPTRPKS